MPGMKGNYLQDKIVPLEESIIEFDLTATVTAEHDSICMPFRWSWVNLLAQLHRQDALNGTCTGKSLQTLSTI